MSFLRSAIYALTFLAFLFFSFNLTSAQTATATGTLSGTVIDKNEAPIAGASVSLTGSGGGLNLIATTGSDGGYKFEGLAPGNYSVLVTREGFASTDVPEITVAAGVNEPIGFELIVPVGAEISVPTVSNVAASRQRSARSTPITRKPMRLELPFNGRSFSSLALLNPGVAVANSNANDLGQFSNNGLRASTNLYLIDAVDVNFGMSTNVAGSTNMALSGAYPATTAFGGTNNLVTLDGMEEFKILTANYNAEFGRQMGAQVQVLTRSGTNNFHGSLYEYFRNDALDARNYFNKRPASQTPLKHHLFGGTIGGPVYFPNLLPSDKPEVPGAAKRSGLYNGKNRTFFFASYEGVRMRQASAGVQFVPSARLRSLAAPVFQPLVNAFPIQTGDETTTFIPCTPPNPNCAPNGRLYSGWGPYTYSVSNPGEADSISVRLDHRINKGHSVFGRFVDSRSDLANGSFTTTNDGAKTQMFTLGVASIITSKMTNEFRFNYGMQSVLRTVAHNPIDGAVAFDPALLTNGLMGEGLIDFSFGGFFNGLRTGTFADNAQQQFLVADSFGYTVGDHQLKFGANYRRLNPHYRVQDQQAALISNQNNLLNGNLNLLAISAIMPVRPRYENFSAFAQDTWKVNKRLTLEFGLRWDVSPAPTEADGIITPVISGIDGTDVSNAALQPFGTSYYKTDYTGFAPRVGAAYLLTQKSGWETVVRGGFGVFYDLGSGTAGNGSPFGLTALRSNVPFPVSAANATRPPLTSIINTPFNGTLYTTDPELKLPYALHWNAAVEQSIGRSQTVSASYVATAGRSLLTTHSLNQPIFGIRPNPNFGTIEYSTNGAESDYHSLQGQYRVRLGHLHGRANYTWSHAIDEVSTDIVSGVFERGNADFDVRHNFSAAVQYDLPFLNVGNAVKYLTKDWYISSIVHVQSGRPVNLTAGTVVIDNELFTRRPDVISGVDLYIDDASVPGGRRFNAAAFMLPMSGQQGTLGRNVLRELPIYQFDVAVGRYFDFTEDVRLTLKAEAFNVLNHPMFGAFGTNIQNPSMLGIPATTLNASLGGLNPTYQIGGPRAVQLAAKLSF